MAFCSRCGTQITEDAAFCVACGMVAPSSIKSQPTPPSVQIASAKDDEASKIFVAKNYEYFLRKWEIGDQNKSKQSWNWAAFLLGFSWMAYRKMYLYSWIVIGVVIVEILCEYAFGFPDNLSKAINLAILATIGWQGNSWYKIHVEKKVKEITAMNTPEQAKIELVRQGGTSIGAAIGFVVALLAIIILVTVVAEPIIPTPISKESPPNSMNNGEPIEPQIAQQSSDNTQQEIPALEAHVTDLTKTFSTKQKEQLEEKLSTFEQQNGSQIAVLIIPSTIPEDISQFSLRVVNTWKLGRAEFNDGVLILVSKDDRKVRIEVGTGLESKITNDSAQHIINDTLAPSLTQGDYYSGINNAVDNLISLISTNRYAPTHY